MSKELKHTRGPWQWQLNERQKDVRLVALHSGSKFVMDFERWGMQGAQPRFNNGFMEPASDLSVIVEGREHHAHWFKAIKHPDACLIAAAPDLLEAIIAIRDVSVDGFKGWADGYSEAIKKAEAAISKATSNQ